MKFFLSIIITVITCWLISITSFLPWYSFVIVSFATAIVTKQQPIPSFFVGFIALFLLWSIWALAKDVPNQHLLSTKVASILPLKGNATLLVIITGFVGGLLGGLGALTGSFLKNSNLK